MKIRDFILSLVSWFILLVTVSCSDELGGERTPISSESNLHVLVPTVLSSRGTNPDDASGLPTYNATVDECQINDLTLYAFPTGNEGKLLKKTLPAPLASMMLEQHVANYQLNIEPGTYHIYVVANMNKVLSGQTIKTEDDLKNIVLNYGAGTAEPGMPVSTNIPMIYEPKDVNGNIIDTKIEKSGDKYTEVVANLKFTCVKVKLNLLFDPTAEGSAFKGKSYRIKDILAQKLSPSTTLSWNGAFSNSNVSKDYAKGFENEVYATSSEASNKGGYYKAEDWTEKADNANVNNKNIITLVQGATPTAAPQNATDKWLFQGTYYLPERYIANASQQSTLKVNGFVNGSFENNYTIKLGHRPTSTEVPTFPRGTYYEIIGNIKSLGNMTLDCNVSVKDWTPVTIDADFNHTTLWVSKTKASVTSTTTVHYLTVQPKESAEGFNFVKKIKVTVKPAMGKYRINFRAINDRAHYKGGNGKGGNGTDNYEGTLEEKKKEIYNGTEGNTNWADGWYDLKNKDGRVYIPSPDHHYTYVYTQIGETTGTEANSKVWKFTEHWPGNTMVADYTNVGWYYVDFKENEKSKYTENGATGEKTIKPGETLIIFSNNTNKELGYTLHRCTHHLEPGIPLFDYEDREGWIVYDPTSDPTWNIYDAMPTIENINFTIYTRFQTYGWFKVYGVANGKNGDDSNKERESFTIYDYDTARNSWSCNKLINGWYKTVITLKAVKGDHEKDIRIKKDNKATGGESVLLFNGNSYEKHNDTGYYDGSSWHAGKPSGVD